MSRWSLCVLLSCLAACRTPSPAEVARVDPRPPGGKVGVHGAWTLEVRNPDGTTVERREFHNDYLPSPALARILAGEITPGGWGVMVNGSTTPNEPCFLADGTTLAGCYLSTGTGAENPLTVEVVSTNLELSGSVTAQRNGNVGSVGTDIHWCSGTVAPVDCEFESNDLFTRTNIAPLALQQHQSLYVTVEISFDTLP